MLISSRNTHTDALRNNILPGFPLAQSSWHKRILLQSLIGYWFSSGNVAFKTEEYTLDETWPELLEKIFLLQPVLYKITLAF